MPNSNKDATFRDYFDKLKDTSDKLNAPDFDCTKPIFVLADGPVTVAAK